MKSLIIATEGLIGGGLNALQIASRGLIQIPAVEDIDFRTGTGSGAPEGFRVRPQKIEKHRIGFDLTREDQEILEIIIEAVLSGVIE